MNRNVWPLTVCNQNTVFTVLQSSNSNMFHTSGSSANLGSTANFDSAEIDAGSSFQHNSTYPTQKQIKHQYSENIVNRSIFCLYGCYIVCFLLTISDMSVPNKTHLNLESQASRRLFVRHNSSRFSDLKFPIQRPKATMPIWNAINECEVKKNHPLFIIHMT